MTPLPMEPFEYNPEFAQGEAAGQEFEEEYRRRSGTPSRTRGFQSRPARPTPTRPRPPARRDPYPRRLERRPRGPGWVTAVEPVGVGGWPAGGPEEPPGAEPTMPLTRGSEYVRWVQSSLNQILGLQLPVNGVMSPETRNAIRDFQRSQRLPDDGIVGPDTERALIAARGETPTGTGAAKPAEPASTLPNAEFHFEWEEEIQPRRQPGSLSRSMLNRPWPPKQSLRGYSPSPQSMWVESTDVQAERSPIHSPPDVSPTNPIPAFYKARWPCGPGGAGSCNTVAVTGGEFGTALRNYTDEYCIPNQVMQSLKLSPTFVNTIADKLDKRYVAFWGPSICDGKTATQKNYTLNADGVITAGPFPGRRVLNVMTAFNGSLFAPFGALEFSVLPHDTIFLDLGQAGIGEQVETIAHESIHAFHLVTRTAKPPAAMDARIRGSITEETDTRREAAAIVSEIKAHGGLKTFTPNTSKVWEVERDFFPGESRQTYLEHFVLDELMRKAIDDEKLTPEAVDKKDKEVKSLSLKGWRGRKFSSGYSKFRFGVRVIDFRWRELSKQHTPGSPKFERMKEQVLQEHANAFFEGVISYTARP